MNSMLDGFPLKMLQNCSIRCIALFSCKEIWEVILYFDISFYDNFFQQKLLYFCVKYFWLCTSFRILKYFLLSSLLLRFSERPFLTMLNMYLSDVKFCHAWEWLLYLLNMLLIFLLHVVHSQELLKSHVGFTSNSSCCFPDCFFCKAVGDTVGRNEVFLCSINGTCRNCLDPASFLLW